MRPDGRATQTVGDDAVKASRLASLLSGVVGDAEDVLLLEQCTHTLGRLVKGGGAVTSDIVEREVGGRQWGEEGWGGVG